MQPLQALPDKACCAVVPSYSLVFPLISSEVLELNIDTPIFPPGINKSDIRSIYQLIGPEICQLE